MITPFMNVALKSLEAYLIDLSVSKSFIRRLKREYRELCSGHLTVVVGGHGKYKCRSELLIPVRGGFAYEVGVDVVTDFDLPKIFVNIYTGTFDYHLPVAWPELPSARGACASRFAEGARRGQAKGPSLSAPST